ncbi:MAG: hypothetical protein U5P10_05275 [Spirochaetia bacterium]|nr:hypothetical protein [Spirochaetia bacterium]
MTRKVRKRFLIGATASAQLVVIVHIAVILILFLFSRGLETLDKQQLTVHEGNTELLIAILALQAAAAAGAQLGLYLFFRKTPSPEVFFFQFALLGFAFSSLRVLAIPMSYYLTSLFSFMPLTKFVFFGRLFAVMCLFLSGLFSTGLTFQKQGSYLAGAFLISAVISISLPVDCTSFSLPLICNIGNAIDFSLVIYVLAVFSVLNYIYAAGLHSSREYSFNAVAVLTVITGMQLVYYFAHSMIGVVGLVLVIFGTFIFAHRTHTIYLWF